MTHTPTPWETRELSNGDWAISQKGAPTAHTTVHTWNGKEESATAQFIVQACTAHDELVAALKAVIKAVGHKFDSELADIVDTALAHAEKGDA